MPNRDGGATRPLPRDGGVEELHGDPTVRPLPKVWTRGQKWKKFCRRWRAVGCPIVGAFIVVIETPDFKQSKWSKQQESDFASTLNKNIKQYKLENTPTVHWLALI